MIANIYLIIFFISVLLTVHILLKNRKIDNIFILFSFLLNLNLAGQYLIAVSQSVENGYLGKQNYVHWGLLPSLCHFRLCNSPF